MLTFKFYLLEFFDTKTEEGLTKLNTTQSTLAKRSLPANVSTFYTVHTRPLLKAPRKHMPLLMYFPYTDFPS